MRAIVFILFLVEFSTLYSQYEQPTPGVVFVEDEVPRIDLFMAQSDIDKILENIESNEEYPATFIFQSSELIDTIMEVGVRLRGNTSRSSAKKSIKISFNTFQPGRKFKGLEKLNLNGEHNDPSVIRSKLCWNLCHQLGIPASRSNHVALYINSQYLGLYINVEHIDEEFAQQRFKGGNGNLYKCLYPADLVYKGANPVVYKEVIFGRRAYDLKTNNTADNYADLAQFINVLNNYQGQNFQCELEKIFDVDTYLKTIVMDVLTSNWDGPIVNKNNFYLYTDSQSGLMTYIPYDLDNTFGIDWFGVDWTQTDIYNWSSESNQPRPIFDNIMAIEEYRNRYSYYFQQTMDDYFSIVELFPYLEEKRDLIKSFRENDSFAGQDYGWTYLDFLRSYDQPLGSHVKNGLVDYISQRVASAKDQLESEDPLPYAYVSQIVSADEVQFRIEPKSDSDLSEIKFHYNIENEGWVEQSIELNENGITKFIFPYTESGIMTYYFELIDNSGQTRSMPLCEDAQLQLGFNPVAKVVINEFMASNSTIATDEAGEYDDWIEIYNAGASPAPIYNYYLSDDPDDPTKWSLPNTILNPHEYMIIWADGDGSQGENHANFKLSKGGEFLGLFDGLDNNNAIIDSLTFPEQETDMSYARLPNADGPFVLTDEVTFDFSNDEFSSASDHRKALVMLTPNPVSQILHIGDTRKTYNFSCHASDGRHISTEKSTNTLNVSMFKSGAYYLLFDDGSVSQFSVIK